MEASLRQLSFLLRKLNRLEMLDEYDAPYFGSTESHDGTIILPPAKSGTESSIIQ